MNLNCKEGDLAVIVRSQSGNEGKIVRCLRLSTELDINRWANGDVATGPTWVVDPPVPHNLHGQYYCMGRIVGDFRLRPLRDGGGEDEILRLAGRPVPVEKEVLNGVEVLTE